MTEPVEFEFSITQQEYCRGLRHIFWRSAVIKLVLVVSAACAVSGVVFQSQALVLLGAFYSAFGFAVVSFRPRRIWRRDPRLGAPHRYRMSADGLTCRTPEMSKHWSWTMVNDIQRGRGMYLVRLASNEVIILPARAFGSRTVESQALEFLERQLGR